MTKLRTEAVCMAIRKERWRLIQTRLRAAR